MFGYQYYILEWRGFSKLLEHALHLNGRLERLEAQWNFSFLSFFFFSARAISKFSGFFHNLTDWGNNIVWNLYTCYASMYTFCIYPSVKFLAFTSLLVFNLLLNQKQISRICTFERKKLSIKAFITNKNFPIIDNKFGRFGQTSWQVKAISKNILVSFQWLLTYSFWNWSPLLLDGAPTVFTGAEKSFIIIQSVHFKVVVFTLHVFSF